MSAGLAADHALARELSFDASLVGFYLNLVLATRLV